MNPKNLNKLITNALDIESKEAKDARALGFMARSLIQATLPHRKVIENEFIRKNGLFTLSIVNRSKIGIPYGSIPRLLLAWITTEAIRTKERHLILGKTLSSFMSELNLTPKSGRLGTISRLKEQMKRLFSASISCTYDDGKSWAIQNVNPVSKSNLWWDPWEVNKSNFSESAITLNEDFFREIVDSPVPIDLRVLKPLARSPLAIDVYCWLTYRVSYLKQNASIPWGVLQLQFGSGYPQTQRGKRDFKRAFIRELKKISIFYKKANFEIEQEFLVLKSSKSHISFSP